MTAAFRLRPGSAADLAHAVRLYDACLGSDKLVSLLFPAKKDDPAAYKKYLYRLYAKRYWSVEWMFTFVVKEGGDAVGGSEVVGFACWKKPKTEISFSERWFTLCESSLVNCCCIVASHYPQLLVDSFIHTYHAEISKS